jgi:hypothetical protein
MPKKEVVMEDVKRFIDNGDNTITDTKTGLMWVNDHTLVDKFDERMTLGAAVKACKELKLAGRKNWRLPTREEWLTIVDLTRYNPAIDPIFKSTKSSWYWASTTVAGYSGGAWVVSFNSGAVYYYGKDYSSYVRPVRSSQ